MKRVIDFLFSTKAAGLYTILFAAAIAIATFIENDFGTSSAQKVVFRTHWFELLLLLFAASILTNVFRFKMIQQKKWTIFTFHISVLIILIGSAITRYLGSEGIMHIREGDTTNQILSSESFLQFSANHNGEEYRFDEQVYFATLGKNKFKKSYLIGGNQLDIELHNFIPNPAEMLEDIEFGEPVIQLVISSGRGREEYVLKYKDFKNINGSWFNFGNSHVDEAFNIDFKDNKLVFSSPTRMTQMQMANRQIDTISANAYYPLFVRTLYSTNSMQIVVGDFKPKGRIVVNSTNPKISNESMCAVVLSTKYKNETKSILVAGNRGMRGTPNSIKLGDLELSASYGSKYINLPFSLKLRDFIMERYPGTNSASSYASEVTLIDNRNNINRDQRIFMNNILNYGGYRFFQSSYDKDELGTVLSVNHDFWGTWVSYLGYFLLTLGMVLTFLNPNSRFRFLSSTLKKFQSKRAIATASIVIICLFSPGLLFGQFKVNNPNIQNLNASHAKKFGELIVQDFRGRMKPVNTMSSEILRKISRKDKLYKQSSDQIILNIIAFPEIWVNIPIIKTGKHQQIQSILASTEEYASYNDFFKSGYVLRDHVRKAYEMEQRNRTSFEKELIKLDERINILNMVLSGSILRLFPKPGDPSNQWEAPGGHKHQPNNFNIEKFYNSYKLSVKDAVQTNNWEKADNLLKELSIYQNDIGAAVIPSRVQTKTEILLNKLNVFSRLSGIYGLFGIFSLTAFFLTVFNPKINLHRILLFATLVFGLAFLFHTLGLAMRWYVSGRAPWSNGYESMIYIAWTTVLSGLIFGRKSFGGLAATSVLASIILLVAGMSWLDPEITPLVPVLKSYWLTIHVSLIAGSYGFLMLGAIIGVINLILMIFSTPANKKRNYDTIKEMTYTSEITLIAGLVMLSVGTYLGGIWANESWGRYWGWDAKETWALVTILVYTFILHMRFIPGFRGFYAFNVASLFGFASVMMTYFGVNYYLSGLHSYAAGDPVPIPPAVYYTAFSLTVIGVLAYWKHKKTNDKSLSVSRMPK